MLHYFYYIWNLLESNERKEVFYHIGRCLLSSTLLVFIEWQQAIVLFLIKLYGITNFFQIVCGMQIVTWLAFIIYSRTRVTIHIKINEYSELITNRHYKYVLTRISKNGSYEWLNKLSPVQLSDNLRLSEVGIDKILNIFTNSVRILGILIINSLISLFIYKASIIFLIAITLSIYLLTKENENSSNYKKSITSSQTAVKNIISDNISILLDSIFHNNEDKIITNITSLQNKNKNELQKVNNHKGILYSNMATLIATINTVFIILLSFFLSPGLNDPYTFYLSSVIIVKLIYAKYGEIYGIFNELRDVDYYFLLMDNIWKNTTKKRKEYKQITLDTKELNLNDFTKYSNNKEIKKINFLENEENMEADDSFILRIYYLNFSYSTGVGIEYKSDKPITLGINSHILIDGPSGSGKTTFLEVFRGIYKLDVDVQNEGKKNACFLTIQNKNEKERYINFVNIANSISYIRQNAISFVEGYIFQIISDDYISPYKDFKDKYELMKTAIKIACLEDKFLDLKVFCNRNTVSGGQIQRISIAKSIYRLLDDDKQIIILDEIDAGLDLHTTRKIVSNLKLLLKDKMLFVVLHTEEVKKLFTNRINIVDGIISI